MLASEVHHVKANFCIAVTESGMITPANEPQPLKASFPTSVTPPGNSATNKSSRVQPDVEKLVHITGLILRKARTSVPGMASDTISLLFNKGVSPTTTSTQLMLRFDSSAQGSHRCSCVLNSRRVMSASNSIASSAPDSCRTVITLAMADFFFGYRDSRLCSEKY